MPAVDDSTPVGRLSFADTAEIDRFVAMLERYERGEISADQWRQFRLVHGTYGQRQTDDAQMLRVKVPQGLLTAGQLDALADVAERYSRGFGHITTRQNVQFHFVRLHDVEPAMRRLADAGLTTREACGNSVRNITACPYAGVAADELFDVTPYAEALTRFLLRHPLGATLPRKFKIAFEGCPDDHVAAAINDLGFHARIAPDGTRGFFVTAGGGTSILCASGAALHDFLPAADVARAAEAVLQVFHRFGDYEHKQRNRMKFLIRALGWDRWREEYGAELAAARSRVPALNVEPPDAAAPPGHPGLSSPSPDHIGNRVAAGRASGPGLPPVVVAVLRTTDEGFVRWRATNVRAQRQVGYAMAVATVPLGDLTSAQLRVLGELARAYGDGTVRMTPEQDLVLRWIDALNVRQLYRRLAAAGLGLSGAGTVADVVSCPGAESCRLAVTQSRGLGRLLEDRLRARPDLVENAGDARIRISGCPNGCGQHHIATIGFQGSVRRVGGRAVPQYFVMVGGGVGPEGARFARLAAKVPARRVPEAVERLVALYAAGRAPGEGASAFFGRVDAARVRQALADLERLEAPDVRDEDLVDLGDTGTFAPVVLDGECAT